MNISLKNDHSGFLVKLDSFFQTYLVDKSPISLPESFKDFLVQILPILSLIFAIVLVPILCASLGLSALFSPLRFLFNLNRPISNIFSLLSWFLSAISLFFGILSISGLFQQTKKGWTYTYYNLLLNFLNSFLLGNLTNGLFSTFLGLYILYQIKNRYQN